MASRNCPARRIRASREAEETPATSRWNAPIASGITGTSASSTSADSQSTATATSRIVSRGASTAATSRPM